MTTTETQLGAPESREDISTELEAWALNDGTPIDIHLARRIALALHEQAGGALETFGRTGELDANSALAELNEVRLPLERETWIDALGEFILEGDRP